MLEGNQVDQQRLVFINSMINNYIHFCRRLLSEYKNILINIMDKTKLMTYDSSLNSNLVYYLGKFEKN